MTTVQRAGDDADWPEARIVGGPWDGRTKKIRPDWKTVYMPERADPGEWSTTTRYEIHQTPDGPVAVHPSMERFYA